MKTLHLPIFTILIAFLVVALSFPSQDAHAMSITVHTDKSLYNYGDTYTISGKVNPVVQNQVVSIVILSPNYPHPSSLSITPNSDGNYSYALPLTIKDVSSGNFTVIAQYGISKNQTTFSYNGPPCVQQNDYWYNGVHSAPASNPRVVDSLGNAITGPVKSGQQIQVTSDLANGKNCAQTFAYIVQIQDLNGVTFSLSWITGTLLAGQSLNPAQSWTPTTDGVYTVQIFTWQSLDNPNALAPPLTTTISVEDDANLTQSSHTVSEISPKLFSGPATIILNSPLGQFKSGIKPDDIKCNNGLSLVIKSEDGSPTCVKPDTAQKLIERGWVKEIATQIANHGQPMKPFGPRIPVYENIANSTPSSFTALSSTVFPTTTMESFDGVSVKGYLTNQNGTGLANQEIMFYLNNATLDNGNTISENLLMGNTTTDQTGCFYFADWDANKSLQFHNEVFATNPSGNGLFNGSDNVLVYINTIFAGTNNLLGSSNATKIMYHPIVPPIIREAGINAYLMNASSFFPHYSAVPILEVERGKSYNFIAFSSWSESLNVQTFRLEIKNLPCGINVPPVDVSDLKNKTQAVIPVKMIIDKTAPSGSFFPYVSVNNHVTQPLDLVVK